MTFSIRGDILKALGIDFSLSHEQQGVISLLAFWGFTISILLVGPLCDSIGMGTLLRLAAIGHIVGVVLTILAPSYAVLLFATLIIGLANGTVEAVCNPLVATMYPDDKSSKLNLFHAFWPGGMIIGGLLTWVVNKAMTLPPDPLPGPATSLSWKIKMATIIVCAVAYLLLLSKQKFPVTERVASGVSNAEMFQAALVPGFLLMLFCMCLTAVTELGPDQWVGSVLTDTVGIQGILFLVYTAGLMFVLRLYASKFIHALSPLGMMVGSALLSCVGLFALSYSFTVGAAFLAATIFGLGKTFFWPTMLGIATERYPRTGALGLALMGAAGMIATSLAGPVMGRIYDKGVMAALPADVQQLVVVDGKVDATKVEALDETQKASVKAANQKGAAGTFRAVAVLPLVLVVIFGLMYAGMKAKGGYQALSIHDTGSGGGGGPGDEG
ncbi:MAG: MFS transporter [Armatimonadetes bacterium]|nr:MFS transporter [Armatimonadota bacterium]